MDRADETISEQASRLLTEWVRYWQLCGLGWHEVQRMTADFARQIGVSESVAFSVVRAEYGFYLSTVTAQCTACGRVVTVDLGVCAWRDASPLEGPVEQWECEPVCPACQRRGGIVVVHCVNRARGVPGPMVMSLRCEHCRQTHLVDLSTCTGVTSSEPMDRVLRVDYRITCPVCGRSVRHVVWQEEV